MKKSIYIGARMLALIERVPADQRNTSRIVNAACDRYAAIVADHLPTLSQPDWSALAIALQDLPPDPFSPAMVRSLCADYDRACNMEPPIGFGIGRIVGGWSSAEIASALDYLEMMRIQAA